MINENEQKCLRALNALLAESDEGMCTYFRFIAKESGLTEKEVRRAVRSLARKGLTEFHRGLFNEDGEVAGAGYCPSVKGWELIKTL